MNFHSSHMTIFRKFPLDQNNEASSLTYHNDHVGDNSWNLSFFVRYYCLFSTIYHLWTNNLGRLSVRFYYKAQNIFKSFISSQRPTHLNCMHIEDVGISNHNKILIESFLVQLSQLTLLSRQILQESVLTSVLESPLSIGITFTILSLFEYSPVEKDVLMTLVNGILIRS